MPTAAELDRIAHEIVGAGITVHSKVGCGCFESTYSPCFGCELPKRGLAYRTQVAIALQCEDITIRRAHEADFIVEGCVVVELKKILAWDQGGFWVLYKRLERGTCAWPAEEDGAPVIRRSSDRRLLLSGVDLAPTRRRRWYERVA